MGLPIATVNVVLRTATVTRAGFGTPIFVSSHRNFVERVRTYTSLTAVGEDFDSTDPAYIAAQQFYAHTPSVAQLKIGRREAAGVFTPTGVETGSVHSITVTLGGGDSATVTYTALISDTAEEVVDAFVTAITTVTGDAEVAAKVGTGASAALTLTPPAAANNYAVSELTNVTASYTSSETAADCMDAIREVDDDFYFVTAEDHTDTFVMAMAAYIQAISKLYFVSTQEQDSITTAYSIASTDILAKLVQGSYTRTATMWNQEADTKFPECNYVGVNAPYSPDRRAVVWDGRVLPGVVVSKNSAGNEITSTQQLNLDNRKASYVISTNAGPRVIGGKTAGNVWIDDQRTLDCITARVKEGQEGLLLNQAGTKVPGGKPGVLLAVAALQKSLNPFVASTALASYTVNYDNAVIDQNTRTLSGLEFTGVLAGAIIRVVIDGSLVNQEV